MNLSQIRENTSQTILKFAIPSIIAMILTSIITIVDAFFIGNYIGKDGIAAVNLGLPLLYIFLAIGIMVGVGGSSIATRMLGSKETDKSISVFNQTIITTLISLLLLSLIVFLFFNPISNIFKVEENVKQYFRSYYIIMLMTYPLMMVNTNLGMFIRAEGKPEVFMAITVVTVIINIVLDFLFIALLDMGIKGTAIASLISVSIGLLLMVNYFKKSSRVFKFRSFSLSKEVLVNTIFNGSSELIGQLSMSITMFVLNYVILREVGITGIAAFTIVGYVSYLFSMIVIGFGQGASPIMSYSYGAKDFKLSIKTRKVTNLFVIVLGVVIFALMNIASKGYSSLFVKNIEVQKMVISGASIFTIAFLFMGVNVITSFYFTSIGMAKESAIISSARGLVILLICILVFPALWGMTGVWLIAPVTEVFTILISVSLIVIHDKRALKIVA